MNRTTITLAPALLNHLKSISRKEDVTIRKLIEELLRIGLENREKSRQKPPKWSWKTHPMQAGIDITDKDALYSVLDGDELVK